MIGQLEFQAIINTLAPSKQKPKAPRTDLNLAAYNIALAASLKAHGLTHALFNILTSVARAQVLRGYATTAQVAIDLGVTFNSVHLQLHKSPDLFLVGKDPTPTGRPPMNTLRLSQESIDLLYSINKKAKRYAQQ